MSRRQNSKPPTAERPPVITGGSVSKNQNGSNAAAAAAVAVTVPQPQFWQRWWLPIALTFACYSPNLVIYASDNEAWIYDDHFSVRSNPCVLGVDSANRPVPWTCIFWADYWGTPMSSNMSHKSYRPVTTAFFMAERAVWGFYDARLWHLGNVATKALATWLFSRVARLCLSSSRESATYATLLFAVHPIHTEAVSNITGQAETLSSVFMLAAFLAHARPGGHPLANFAASVLAAVAATLCKEPGFSVLAVICAHVVSAELRGVKAKRRGGDSESDDNDVARNLGWRDLRSGVRGVAWLRLLGYCGAGSVIFAGRCWVQGERPQYSGFMNPGGFHASRLARGLTMAHYAVTHARLMLAPVTLCPDYSNSAIPEVETLLDQRCLVIYAAAICLAWAAVAMVTAALDRRKDVHELVTCTAWLVLPFLPVSNLFFTVGFAVAERVLFAPSIGFCLLAGLGIRRLSEILSQAATDQARSRLLTCLHRSLHSLLILLAVRTALRDLDWNNGRSLWTSSYKACATNANTLANLAITETGNPGFQRFLFEKAATAGRPFSPDHSVDSLAHLLHSQGQHREMLELCQRYAHLGNPRNVMCMANARLQLRMYSDAAANFEQVYSQMDEPHWHLTRLSYPDVVKGYARSLALAGSDLAASVINKHLAAMPEPMQLHLLVSSTLLAAQRNRTDDFHDGLARLANGSAAGPALTDLAKELQDLGRHQDALTALSALPAEARAAPIASFLRWAAQDGLYTKSERCAAKERLMQPGLAGLSPLTALEALADMAERAVEDDLADSDFSLLHFCRLLAQPIAAIYGRFGRTPAIAEGLAEVHGIFLDGQRGELTMHPRLMMEPEKVHALLADLRRTARQLRATVAEAEVDWGDWRMLPTEPAAAVDERR